MPAFRTKCAVLAVLGWLHAIIAERGTRLTCTHCAFTVRITFTDIECQSQSFGAHTLSIFDSDKMTIIIVVVAVVFESRRVASPTTTTHNNNERAAYYESPEPWACGCPYIA